MKVHTFPRCFERLSLLTVFIILVSVVCFSPSTGSANDASEPTARKSLEQEAGVRVRKDARGRKVQYVDFGETMIEGRAKTPDGFVIQSRTSGKFSSLIELRRDFRDKISLNALETATLPTTTD